MALGGWRREWHTRPTDIQQFLAGATILTVPRTTPYLHGRRTYCSRTWFDLLFLLLALAVRTQRPSPMPDSTTNAAPPLSRMCLFRGGTCAKHELPARIAHGASTGIALRRICSGDWWRVLLANDTSNRKSLPNTDAETRNEAKEALATASLPGRKVVYSKRTGLMWDRRPRHRTALLPRPSQSSMCPTHAVVIETMRQGHTPHRPHLQPQPSRKANELSKDAS